MEAGDTLQVKEGVDQETIDAVREQHQSFPDLHPLLPVKCPLLPYLSPN